MSTPRSRRYRVASIIKTAVLFAILSCFASPAVLADPANSKLSGTLVTDGDVSGFFISPDGTTVLYLADQEDDGTDELYTVPIDTSASPIKVNDPLPAGGNVLAYSPSPDSTRVVYLVDQNTDEIVELYSAPLDGSGPPVGISALFATVCTKDGESCQTHADCPPVGNCPFTLEFCESDDDCVGAGNICQLIEPQTCEQFGDVESFLLSPDSSRVVYFADQNSDDVLELYSAPIDGSAAPVKLNDTPVLEGDLQSALISDDSGWVVYLADQDVNDSVELYSAPIDGSAAPVKLNPAFSHPQEDVTVFALGGMHAVYLANQDSGGVFELFSAPIDGSSAAVKLNGPLPAASDVNDNFAVNFDATWVFYEVDRDPLNADEFYGAPIDGSAPAVKLNLPLGPTEHTFQSAVSPNSKWAAFYLSDPIQDTDRLYSVPVDGSAPAVVVAEDRAFGIPMFIRGSRVFFADFGPGPPPGGPPGISSVTADGSQPLVELTGDPTPGGAVQFLDFPRPEATVIAYLGDLDTDNVREMYLSDVTGAFPRVKINGPLVAGGNVALPVWINSVNLTETHVVYMADQDTVEVVELYTTRLDLDGDGVFDDTDNCRRASNGSQDPATFDQGVMATTKTEFSWPVTTDVRYVRGPLSGVSVYQTDTSGTMTDVVAFTDPVPAVGEGYYYLLSPGGNCAATSWQSEYGAEPTRDAHLP